MEILYTDIVIEEASFAPVLTVLYLKNGLFYIHHQKTSFLVLERTKIKDKDFLLSCLENQNYANNLEGEELIIKYPSLSSIILPYLRDKKIDKLI